MGVTDAPSWLLSAFVRSVLAVGASAPREEIEATARRLAKRWQEPERAYHNVRHLIDVLARVDELAQETHNPDVVRLAAWYHGAVFSAAAQSAYARRGGEDEAAGADLARAELTALGVPAPTVERVHHLIHSLRRHDADPDDIDALALCDADLGVLAVEPQRYAAYRSAVRQEYAHLPLRDYLEARIAILTKLLGRRRLFVSPFSSAWEEPARENLQAELHRLQGELARLDAADPGAGAAPGNGPRTARPADGDTPSGADHDAPRRRSAAGPWRESLSARSAATPESPSWRGADGRGPDPRKPRRRPTEEKPESFLPRPRAWEEDEAVGAPGAPPLPAGIERDPAPLPPRPGTVADTSEGGTAGIEREPHYPGDREREKERRGRRRRPDAEESSTPASDDNASTASLFRPPPSLPRS